MHNITVQTYGDTSAWYGQIFTTLDSVKDRDFLAQFTINLCFAHYDNSAKTSLDN